MLGGFGIVIGVVDRLARNVRPLETLTWGHGIIFGLAQSLALIPGVSRSGATITAGLALGYKREAAARYSFLLAIPAVVGSGLFKLADIADDPVRPAWGPIVLATVVAFVIGYAVIPWLLRYISTHNFLPFVIYRIALAARGGRPAAHRRADSPAGLIALITGRPRDRSAADAGAVEGLGGHGQGRQLLLHRAAVGRQRAGGHAGRRPAPAAGRRSGRGRRAARSRSMNSYGTAAAASRCRRPRNRSCTSAAASA